MAASSSDVVTEADLVERFASSLETLLRMGGYPDKELTTLTVSLSSCRTFSSFIHKLEQVVDEINDHNVNLGKIVEGSIKDAGENQRKFEMLQASRRLRSSGSMAHLSRSLPHLEPEQLEPRRRSYSSPMLGSDSG